MTRNTAALFGGAVFVAGITTQAPAQEFEFLFQQGGTLPTTFIAAYANNMAGHGGCCTYASDTNYSPSTAVNSLHISYVVANAWSYVTETVIGGVSEPGITPDPRFTSVAWTKGDAYFTVLEPARLAVTWNFNDEFAGTPFEFSNVSLTDVTGTPVVLLDVSADSDMPPAGFASLDLIPGNRYLYRSISAAWQPGNTFVTGELLPPRDGDCSPRCYADCNQDETLNIDDVDCFVHAFIMGDLATADCDMNGALSIDDVDCFIVAFTTACAP
ncbi:MAG: hypothetical protein DHS20C14_17830 [Phycisphaeraceae bacterium]|nr:MAG: hypothetical protein DHS20C14_17830 [Phycisphaeraceae bacterium]